MKKTKEPSVPPERGETIRRQIIGLLEGQVLSARDLSAIVGASIKDIYDHLAHIQRTVAKGKVQFFVEPSVCKECGFVFKKRDRLEKPGRCPVCRKEFIGEPLFSIKNR